MRLTKQITNALVHVLMRYLTTHNTTEKSVLYLFGSRTDDSKLGGDIDLLLLTSAENKKKISEKKHILLEQLREAAGDQRVDLTLKTPLEAKDDPFVKSLSLLELHVF